MGTRLVDSSNEEAKPSFGEVLDRWKSHTTPSLPEFKEPEKKPASFSEALGNATERAKEREDTDYDQGTSQTWQAPQEQPTKQTAEDRAASTPVTTGGEQETSQASQKPEDFSSALESVYKWMLLGKNLSANVASDTKKTIKNANTGKWEDQYGSDASDRFKNASSLFRDNMEGHGATFTPAWEGMTPSDLTEVEEGLEDRITRADALRSRFNEDRTQYTGYGDAAEDEAELTKLEEQIKNMQGIVDQSRIIPTGVNAIPYALNDTINDLAIQYADTPYADYLTDAIQKSSDIYTQDEEGNNVIDPNKISGLSDENGNLNRELLGDSISDEVYNQINAIHKSQIDGVNQAIADGTMTPEEGAKESFGANLENAENGEYDWNAPGAPTAFESDLTEKWVSDDPNSAKYIGAVASELWSLFDEGGFNTSQYSTLLDFQLYASEEEFRELVNVGKDICHLYSDLVDPATGLIDETRYHNWYWAAKMENVLYSSSDYLNNTSDDIWKNVDIFCCDYDATMDFVQQTFGIDMSTEQGAKDLETLTTWMITNAMSAEAAQGKIGDQGIWNANTVTDMLEKLNPTVNAAAGTYLPADQGGQYTASYNVPHLGDDWWNFLQEEDPEKAAEARRNAIDASSNQAQNSQQALAGAALGKGLGFNRQWIS